MASNSISRHVRSNVVGYIALFCFAIGGTAYATHPGGANTISSADIINGEVTSRDLGDGEVKSPDLAADSVGSGKIADRQVKNADLSLGASASNTIADGGVQSIDVKDGDLTGADVKADSLTGADIDEDTLVGGPTNPTGPAGGDLTGTYPNPQIAANALNSAKVADDSLTGEDIAEASLGKVPDADTLDGLSSADFLSGYRVFQDPTAETVAATHKVNFTECPPGKVVIGGGAFVVGPSGSATKLVGSAPVFKEGFTASSWRSASVETSPVPDNEWTLTNVVVCVATGA